MIPIYGLVHDNSITHLKGLWRLTKVPSLINLNYYILVLFKILILGKGEYMRIMISILMVVIFSACTSSIESKSTEVTSEIKVMDQSTYESHIHTHNDWKSLTGTTSQIDTSYENAVTMYNDFIKECAFTETSEELTSAAKASSIVLRKTVQLRGLADFIIYQDDYKFCLKQIRTLNSKEVLTEINPSCIY